MMFFLLAWRNVWRNTRRTLITLSAVSFGLASLIVFFGASDGFHSEWVENAVRLSSGHIQIHMSGYHLRPDIRNVFSPGPVVRVLEGMPGVKGISPRLETRGLASTAENSSGVLVIGLDPADRSGITDLRASLITGEYALGGRNILIGATLGRRLGAGTGDKIVIMTQTAHASLGSQLFRVAGTFRAGSEDFDSHAVLVDLADAQTLTEAGARVTGIAVLARNADASEGLRDRLAALPALRGYEALDWSEQIPMLKQGIDIDNVSLYFIAAILLIVIAFGISNAVLMSVMERTREFGVMLSLGTKPGRLIATVLLEAVIIAAAGVAGGVALGLGVNGLLGVRGIDLSRWAQAMEFFATIKPVIYPETRIGSVLLSSGAVFAAAVIPALYPAIRAARLRPVEALRYG
jgi:putative ABC transport system permease protein